MLFSLAQNYQNLATQPRLGVTQFKGSHRDGRCPGQLQNSHCRPRRSGQWPALLPFAAGVFSAQPRLRKRGVRAWRINPLLNTVLKTGRERIGGCPVISPLNAINHPQGLCCYFTVSIGKMGKLRLKTMTQMMYFGGVLADS